MRVNLLGFFKSKTRRNIAPRRSASNPRPYLLNAVPRDRKRGFRSDRHAALFLIRELAP
jgi:hypothetical protein